MSDSIIAVRPSPPLSGRALCRVALVRESTTGLALASLLAGRGGGGRGAAVPLLCRPPPAARARTSVCSPRQPQLCCGRESVRTSALRTGVNVSLPSLCLFVTVVYSEFCVSRVRLQRWLILKQQGVRATEQ